MKYRKGDADPTPKQRPKEGYCEAKDKGEYSCTWPNGHKTDQHVAGSDGHGVVHAWDRH